MHAFLSNLAHRQTDKRARTRERKHIPPPLSEVNNTRIYKAPKGLANSEALGLGRCWEMTLRRIKSRRIAYNTRIQYHRLG